MVSSIMAEKEKVGHRHRLRERFLAGSPEEYSDEMLLELLLTFAIERKDVRPIAQGLIQIFGNLDHVLSASPEDLRKVKGIGPSSIALLKVVDFIQLGAKQKETKVPPLSKTNAAQQNLFNDLRETPTLEEPYPRSNGIILEAHKPPLISTEG